MPNWCSNVMRFKASGDVLEYFVLHEGDTEIEFFEVQEAENFFDTFHPIPKDIKRGPLTFEDMQNNSDNWYTWCIENWGTKWDARVDAILVDQDAVTVCFKTAWSPPIEFARKFSESVQDLTMHYIEPGMAYAGSWNEQEDDCCYELCNYNHADELPSELVENFGNELAYCFDEGED